MSNEITMYCEKCGKQIEDGTRFCSYCGVEAEQVRDSSSTKNGSVARGFNLNKIILPVSILLAAVILGGFFYAAQLNKQQSIERQQALDTEQENRKEQDAKEQQQKEYIAKRKNDCYQIYLKERDEWNNVEGSSYDEVGDVCRVTYTDTKPKRSQETCSKIKENMESVQAQGVKDIIFRAYMNCLNHTFDKEF